MVKLYVKIGVFEVTEQHETVSFDVTNFVEPLEAPLRLTPITDSVNTPILTHFMHITILHQPNTAETSIGPLESPTYPIHPFKIHTDHGPIKEQAHIHPLEASIAPYFTHRYSYCHIILTEVYINLLEASIE